MLEKRKAYIDHQIAIFYSRPSIYLSLMNTQIHFITHIPETIDQSLELCQSFATCCSSPLPCQCCDRSYTAQQLPLRIIGGMNQYRFTAKDMWNSDLLALFWIAPFLQLILPYRNTANARNIIAVGQFNGMADMLPVKGQCTVGALNSIFTMELERVPTFHNSTLRYIYLYNGHGIVGVVF